MSASELAALAAHFGVQPGYWDTKGAFHEAEPDALVAVLRAAGVAIDAPDNLMTLRRELAERGVRALPPVVVAWVGQPLVVECCLPADQGAPVARVTITLEEGGQVTADVALDRCPEVHAPELDGRGYVTRQASLLLALPIGYHRLLLEAGTVRAEAWLLVAPERVVEPPADERSWGVFAPVYSLRAELGAGPHIGHLQAVGRWIHDLGGRVVASLPVLAAYLDTPFDPSPYAPVSRRFWNELYLDLERVPELAHSAEARAVLDAPATQHEIAELRQAHTFEYRRQAALTSTVLTALAATFGDDPGAEADAYHRFLAARPDVVDYAWFRAAVHHFGSGWHAWPEPARSGRLDHASLDQGQVRRHLYAQFAMHRQMTALADDLSGRGQYLYLDLPVGAHGDGYDTWVDQHLFAWGAGTGAPPDDFFTEGQNWGFPPMVPARSQDEGHRHFAECLRHHMRVAGMLRLDHVMQLERLYWVPDGMSAEHGVYVHYPREELFAVVAIESARSGCVVVGEDLGTVPDEIRHAMRHHGLLSMYVAQFQLPSWPGADLEEPRHHMLASVDTHDTPTFTGFLRGLDIARRRDMGLLDDEQARVERAEREQAVANLVRFLAERELLDEPGDEHAILRGLLRHLGSSEASSLLVPLDDLWGETDPHNVPGTGLDRPNWVQRMREPLAELAADPRVRADLEQLRDSRLAAARRAAGAAS